MTQVSFRSQRQSARASAIVERSLWHDYAHGRLWAGYRARRWRWPKHLPPNVLTLALAAFFAAWAVYRAVLPPFAPGPTDIPQAVRDRAAVLFALCWAPTIIYLLSSPGKRRPIPFYATYGCLYSLYYAITPMFGSANIFRGAHGAPPANPRTDYGAAVDLLLAGWLLLTAGYLLAPRLTTLRRSRLEPLLERLPKTVVANWAFVLLLIGIVSELALRLNWWPSSLLAVSNLFTLLMEAALVILAALWRAQKLSRWGSTAMWSGVGAVFVLTLGGSATGRLIFELFAIFIGIWLQGPIIRARYIVIGAVALAGCVAVRGVMSEWRRIVWDVNRGQVSSSYRSALMIRMLRQRYEEQGAVGMVATGWNAVTERSANVDLLIDVMHRTPDEVPYWDGHTYQSLIGTFVPRFLWPDKPEKTLGQDFGHRYRYIADSDVDTSINLPVVVEFYVNFGTGGVLLGMLLLGILLKLIEEIINRPGQALLVSAIATPLLARMLVMECDLSLIFGGLPMQILSIWLFGRVMLMTAGVPLDATRVRAPWYGMLWPRRKALPVPAKTGARRSAA